MYKGMCWNKKYLAYCCSTEIYIVDFVKKEVMVSLNEHKKRVQSLVTFTMGVCEYLVSVAADG